MSDTPETDEQINGKPCTRFAIYAGDSLRDALVPSEFARKLERERNSLQDQRDFCMGEIKRLRTEYFEMLDSAWGLIANAGGGNWDLQTEEWRQAAICFRNWYLSTPASSEEREMEAAK